MSEERYMKAGSAMLAKLRDELIEIEAQRVALVNRTTEIIAEARDLGYDRPTVGHLEALTYNTPKTDTTVSLAYLERRMYIEPEPITALPGMTPTPPVTLPGM